MYYVRQSGSDSNNGTSAATAFRTIGKLLGATGMASGDTAYIGAGTYRETVTVAMTSATAETKIIGDVTGQYTGDAGEVIWSAYTAGDFAGVSTSPCLTMAGRDYLTLENITFIGGNNSTGGCVYNAATATAQNVTLRACTFLAYFGAAGAAVRFDVVFGDALNLTVTGCRFWGLTGLQLNGTGSATGSHYNLNVTVDNCWFLTGTAVLVAGSNTYNGNGATVSNCTGVCWNYFARTSAAATNTTYPLVVRNCVQFAYQGLAAAASGQITDGGGNLIQPINAAVVNVTAAATTRSGSIPNPYPLELGQSAVLGLPYRHPLMSYASSGTFPGGSLGFGNVAGGTTTSITGRARPSGSGVILHTGTVTSATSSTLTDSNASFPINGLTGALVRVNGLVKRIGSSTKTQLTISGAAPSGGLWSTTPSAGDSYIVYQGPQVETGKATSATATTLVDSGASWATNQWSGYAVVITGGTNATSTEVLCTSNTGTTISVAAWANGTPDNTSTYALYWPGTSLTATQSSAGAFELGDTAKAETTTTDSGTGVRIDGAGCQDLTIPVDTTATTITVKARYDSNHGTTTKPQLQLLAAGELGVSAATATMTGAADTWETLSVGPFTPTATGVVTIRLVSRSATPYGVAFFDTIGVS